MSGLQEFLGALRAGNLDQAKQIYTNMVPRSAEETLAMNRRQDELVEDKSPRKWREDAATTTRRAGANRTGASLITGDNPLGIGAVDIAAPTAIPAAMADFRETREGVRRGEVGPLEYAAMAAAVPLSVLPAGAVAGKAIAKGAKAVDKAGEAAVKQTRKLLGKDAPMSVRMPDDLTVGQKLSIANTGDPKIPPKYQVVDTTQYGELDQRPFYIPNAPTADRASAEAELASLNRRPTGSAVYEVQKAPPEIDIKPEANPARSREEPSYYHGVRSEIGQKEPIDDILEEGFKKGKSSELGDLGTSVSGDPTMSLRNFAGNKTGNMLVVEVDDAVKVQNTDPYTYLMKEHRNDNPMAVRKPNIFKEDETFFRQEGGGQQQLRARLPDKAEINFMKRGAQAVDDTYKDVYKTDSADAMHLLGMETPVVTAKDVYNTVRAATQGVSNLREFGRATSTSAAYDVANSLVKGLGKDPSRTFKLLGPTQSKALSDTYGWATDLNKARELFENISRSLKYNNPISAEKAGHLASANPDIDFYQVFVDDLDSGLPILTPGPETKKLINRVYSELQKTKTKFLDSADKLSVAFALGASGAALTNSEASATTTPRSE